MQYETMPSRYSIVVVYLLLMTSDYYLIVIWCCWLYMFKSCIHLRFLIYTFTVVNFMLPCSNIKMWPYYINILTMWAIKQTPPSYMDNNLIANNLIIFSYPFERSGKYFDTYNFIIRTVTLWLYHIIGNKSSIQCHNIWYNH